MCGGLVGDIVNNEISHTGNLFSQMGAKPWKTLEQFALGAGDPLSAKLWGGVTGQKFTPFVNQFGGETKDQFEQSKRAGVNVGPSMTLGGIADTIAGIWGGYEAGGALGNWMGGLGGDAAGGAADTGSTGSLGMGDYTSAYDAELGGADVTSGGAEAGAGGGGVGTSDFGGVGTDPSVTGGGGATANNGWLQTLQSLFKTGVGGSGGAGGNSGTRGALGVMQMLSSLYGMEQSRKLSKEASAQSVSNAGLQAVQRSMAAQGYQGSGNMMAALSKYGADAYGSNLAQKQASLQSTMSGLGLLTAGMSNFGGWASAGNGG